MSAQPEKPSSGGRFPRWSKTSAGYVSGIIVIAVLSPVLENFREPGRDDFPLSYYPMFSSKRPSTTRIEHAVGVTKDGDIVPIYHTYLGSGGQNQIRKQTRKMVRAGRADELCAYVAKRVASSSRKSLRDIVEVRIVTCRYDLDNFFEGEVEPIKTEVHASFPVVRKEQD